MGMNATLQCRRTENIWFQSPILIVNAPSINEINDFILVHTKRQMLRSHFMNKKLIMPHGRNCNDVWEGENLELHGRCQESGVNKTLTIEAKIDIMSLHSSEGIRTAPL